MFLCFYSPFLFFIWLYRSKEKRATVESFMPNITQYKKTKLNLLLYSSLFFVISTIAHILCILSLHLSCIPLHSMCFLFQYSAKIVSIICPFQLKKKVIPLLTIFFFFSIYKSAGVFSFILIVCKLCCSFLLFFCKQFFLDKKGISLRKYLPYNTPLAWDYICWQTLFC